MEQVVAVARTRVGRGDQANRMAAAATRRPSSALAPITPARSATTPQSGVGEETRKVSWAMERKTLGASLPGSTCPRAMSLRSLPASATTAPHSPQAMSTAGREHGRPGVARSRLIVTEPVRVPLESQGTGGIVSLAAGEYHSCAVQSDGTVLCWGSDRQGQLGIGWGYEAPPTALALPGSAFQVTAGDFFTCVLLSNEGQKQVWCFGQNHYGQLGDGTQEDRSFAVRALLNEGVQRIDAGGFFVIASLEGDGYPPLHGWGENGAGQLGP